MSIGFVPAHLQAGSGATTTTSSVVRHSSEPRPTEVILGAEAPPQEFAEEQVVVQGGADWTNNPLVAEPVCMEEICGPAPFYGRPCWWETRCLWGSAEFLLWWTRGMDLPPLATTSPDGTLMNQAGVLGQSGTTVLFGDAGVNDLVRPGGRFTLGKWLDPCRCRGIEATYLFLGGKTESFSASSDDFSILARPFFNVQDNAQDARRIAFPGEVSGNLNIQADTEFQAFEALYRFTGISAPGRQVRFLVGYRFAQLKDQVLIREFSEALSGPIAGTTINLADDFSTRNTFHGGELGIVIASRPGACWSWEAAAKVALGSTRTRASVFGETTTTAGGASTTTQAGLLAQATNIGVFEKSDFSTVSEFNFTLRRQLHCGVSLSLGYTFLYWSEVARAGSQIDFGVNPSQIPPGMLMGSARPAFSFNETGFWAQGLRFGVDYAY